jgi:hypothetical protein
MHTNFNDAEFMANSLEWPNPRILPVKRWLSEKLECGILLSSPVSDRPLSTVYLVNMFALSTADDVIDLLKDPTKREEYPSFTALVEAGWMVD